MQPDQPADPTATTKPEVPAGGTIMGVAALQWGWAVKKTWLSTREIKDRSTLNDVARQLTELIAGEAFLQSRIRKFSAAESFYLFMEGVRFLQLYDAQASLPAPQEAVLKQTLKSAQDSLRECVSNYPADTLPRYYLGIVYTYHAQVEQALYFQSLLAAGAFTLPQLLQLPPRTKYYLERAAEEFRQTAANATGDLKLYAIYNQAQALARLDGN